MTMWTIEHDQLADMEGWGIFIPLSDGHADIEVQGIDDYNMSDDEAHALILRLAERGSAFHLFTLCYIGEHAPEELNTIVNGVPFPR